MNKHWAMAIAFIGLAACATSGPESSNTAATAAAPVHGSDALDAESSMQPANIARAAATPDIADENSIYCRKEKLTGSRIAQVVCMTPTEKERIRAISQMNADAAKRSAGAVPQKN